MPMENIPQEPPVRSVAEETLIANLRNAHALEKQVIAVLKPQLGLLVDYPDLQAKITQHIAESRQQANRLQTALEACGSSTSMVKDALLSVMGLGQSSVQGFSSDAVLKAIVADMMTEHLEIATYRTLIVLAEMAGKSEICPALEASLQEEEAMAEWFSQNLEQLTRRYIELEAAKVLAAELAEQERARKREEMAAEKRSADADGVPRPNPAADPFSRGPSDPAPAPNASRESDAAGDVELKRPPTGVSGP
ncbi:ferritin-like domain-containing protein [Tabrizicola piscis]|uniref:Ferritin-like domain-containing protein n=1 Tax=Tabrizicola piscis TaxID=2494374 RepID=A0A3S8U2F4_9RHOB|nr:ferritin-like domain-containing protein [Tabrizicola piscis]AZL57746.1 ferritin-like domain-containing protein [Tabrizicola piscis]